METAQIGTVEREWTIPELVRATGVSKSTIHRAKDDGELTFIDVGRGSKVHARIAESEWLRWMESRKIRARTIPARRTA